MLDWRLGHATESSAIVFVRSDVSETVELVIAGSVRGSVAVDTGIKDGTGIITVTGLSARRTAFSLQTSTGQSGSGTLKTMPAAGVPYRVCWVSCIDMLYGNPGARQVVAADPDVLVILGDMPYSEANATPNMYHGALVWPDPEADMTAGTTISTYHKLNLSAMRHPDLREMLRCAPIYYQIDDHDAAIGDGWDHGLVGANTYNAALAADQADVDALWQAGQTGNGDYWFGTLPNAGTDDDIVSTDKPGLADAATPASNYPVRYFRFSVGDVEFFVPDCVSYKSDRFSTDNASKTLIGVTQKAWLKGKVVNSSKSLKFIMSTKKFHRTTPPNGDEWAAYSTEFVEITDHFATEGVTGLYWFTGDKHQQDVGISSADSTSPYYDSRLTLDVCMFNSSALGYRKNDTHDQGAGYDNNIAWKGLAYHGDKTLAQQRNAYGMIDIKYDAAGVYAEVSMIEIYGASSFRGAILRPGTNMLEYQRARIA